MAFDIGTLVIDRPIRGMMFNSAGNVLWAVTDFKDPKLTATTDTQNAVNALGVVVNTFDRAKKVEFSATKANVDLGLIAARGGVDKRVGTNIAPVVTPCWEEFTVADSATTITLTNTPYAPTGGTAVPYIWALNEDQTLGTRFILSDTSASATEFTISTKTITLPTTRSGDMTFLVPYEYEATGASNLGAVEVDYSSDKFPAAGKFAMMVLAHSICDAETQYAAWLVFPKAKLSSDVDITLNPEATDTFKLTALPAYCTTNRSCFKIIVPEDADTDIV